MFILLKGSPGVASRCDQGGDHGRVTPGRLKPVAETAPYTLQSPGLVLVQPGSCVGGDSRFGEDCSECLGIG